MLAQRPVGVDGLHLGDDVELAAPVALQRDVAGGLQPSAEAAPRLAHALRHRPHLAVTLGEEADDPVGLPQLDRAQHDPLVPVQVHYTSVIRCPTDEHLKVRCACDANFEMFAGRVDGAEATFAALVLGDGGEEVVASELGPADVGEHELGVGRLPHEEADVVRVSSPVRTIRSGSGMSGAVRWAASASSSIDDGRRSSGAHLLGQRRHRVGQLDPTVVVDGQRERHAVVGRGHRLGLGDHAAPAAAAPARRDARDRGRARRAAWKVVAPREEQPLGVGERASRHLERITPPLAGQHLDREPAQPDARARRRPRRSATLRRCRRRRSRRDPGTWCRSTSAGGGQRARYRTRTHARRRPRHRYAPARCCRHPSGGPRS